MSECFFYALRGDVDNMMATLPTHVRSSKKRAGESKVSVNIQDSHGRSPLHFAVLGRSAACVSALLSKKIKISLTDENGFTALHYAVKNGDVTLTEMIMNNVGKNATDKMQDDPPLLYAADCGNAAFVPLLAGITPAADTPVMHLLFHRIAMKGSVAFARAAAEAGYKIDESDENGATPLLVAATGGHSELVDFLLQEGVDAHHVDNKGRNVLHCAAMGDLHKDTISKLVAAAGKDALSAVDKRGYTPLHLAAMNGSIDSLYAMLKEGAACDARVENSGLTPLHVACASGRTSCVAALLMNNADPNVATSEGLTPLHVAARNANAGICALLLRSGAKVAAKAKNGMTPLHCASFREDFRTIGVLFDHGAFVNAQDEFGSTPLHVAAACGNRLVCKLLLKNGADINMQDNAGNTALVSALARGQLVTLQVLLQNGCNPEIQNKDGDNTIHIAARLGALESLTLIMDSIWKIQTQRFLSGEIATGKASPANVNAQNKKGQTPLHCALENDHVQAFKVLILKGCDPNEGSDSTHDGKNPAQLAVENKVFPQSELDSMNKARLVAARERDRSSPEYQARLKEVRARAVQLFNNKPKLGIEHMQKSGMMGEEPQDIAEFLHETPGLNKTKIGEYVGGSTDFHKAVLLEFVRALKFKNLEFEMALRRFLTTFRLPGEAQVIDRIMEAFAKHYYEDNPNTVFANADAVYVLAFSTIMLNTDAHSANVKNKMTKPQWLATNRKINDGQDFPQEFLETLYDRIVEDEIKMEQGMFTNAEKKGWLTKQGGRIKTWKRRWFILNDTGLYYFKKPQDSEPCGIIMLDNVEIVRYPSKKNGFLLRYSSEVGEAADGSSSAAPAAAAAAAQGDGTPRPSSAAPVGGKNLPAKLKGCKMDGGSMTQSHHKVYVFCAESASEMESWVTAINSCVHHNPFFALMAQKTTGGVIDSGGSQEGPVKFVLEK